MGRSWSTCEVGATARNPCTSVLVRSIIVPGVAMKFVLTVICTPDSSIIIWTVTLATLTRWLLRAQSASPPFCGSLNGEPGEVGESNFSAWYLASREGLVISMHMLISILQQSPTYLHMQDDSPELAVGTEELYAPEKGWHSNHKSVAQQALDGLGGLSEICIQSVRQRRLHQKYVYMHMCNMYRICRAIKPHPAFYLPVVMVSPCNNKWPPQDLFKQH